MTNSKALRDSAIANALSSITRERRFPNKVFFGDWEDYLFFDPTIIFDEEFFETKELLMDEGGDSVIAIVNLGNNVHSDSDPRAIFLEKETRSTEYISKLTGDGSAMNWMFLMDRYVCGSDRGNWVIYCEKENDIAAFAFRNDFPRSICSRLEKLLKAKSIRSPTIFREREFFDFDKLVPKWKSTLMSEYGS